MEITIGEEEETVLEIQLENTDVNNAGFPVVYPASYGRILVFLPKYIKYVFTMPLRNLIFCAIMPLCAG